MLTSDYKITGFRPCNVLPFAKKQHGPKHKAGFSSSGRQPEQLHRGCSLRLDTIVAQQQALPMDLNAEADALWVPCHGHGTDLNYLRASTTLFSDDDEV
jgi:hypothetical protein